MFFKIMACAAVATFLEGLSRMVWEMVEEARQAETEQEATGR